MNQKVLTVIPLALMFFSSIAITGCGYTTESQYRTDVRSVYVPMWTRGRNVYEREVEMRLTEAIIKRIELDTPYKVVSKKTADTELSGEIRRISQRVLSQNPDTNRPRELEVTFRLEFTWKDLRNGEILVKKEKFDVSGTYVPDLPYNEDFFRGAEDVINNAAKRVVETMEAEW